MGPANFAAQGYIWSRALEKNIPGVRGMSMMIGENPYAFPTDYQVPLQLPEKALWTVRQRDWVQRNFTHVFIEAFRGLCDRTIPLVKEVERSEEHTSELQSH